MTAIHFARVMDEGDNADPIRPLVIVGDAATFLGGYCVESESLRERGITPERWDLRPLDVCGIDPGGMSWGGEAVAEREIDGAKFSVVVWKAAAVASVWKQGRDERVPGWRRSRGGFGKLYVMPVETHAKVVDWLTEVAMAPDGEEEFNRIEAQSRDLQRSTRGYRRLHPDGSPRR